MVLQRVRVLAVVCLGMLATATLSGCAGDATVSREQFESLYNDETKYTDVWYTGSDADFHHFCMEHWTLKPDGSDATLDSQQFYRVPVNQLHLNQTTPVSKDQDKWTLMRPKRSAAGLTG